MKRTRKIGLKIGTFPMILDFNEIRKLRQSTIHYSDFNFNNALNIEKETTRSKSNKDNIQRDREQLERVCFSPRQICADRCLRGIYSTLITILLLRWKHLYGKYTRILSATIVWKSDKWTKHLWSLACRKFQIRGRENIKDLRCLESIVIFQRFKSLSAKLNFIQFYLIQKIPEELDTYCLNCLRFVTKED